MTTSRRSLNCKTKKNKGGKSNKYKQRQIQNLLNLGFTNHFIDMTSRSGIGYNRLSTNFENSGKTIQEYMKDIYEELEINPHDELTDIESGSSRNSSHGGKRRNKKTRKHRKKRIRN